MRRIKLYIALIVVIYACCSSSASEEDFPCEESRELQEKCGKFAYRVVHPLLDYIRQFRQQINDSEAKDREIKELQNKLIQEQRNTVTTNDLRAQIVFQQSTINRLMANTNPKTTTENCELVKSALADKAAKLKENENQLASLNHKLTKKTLNLQQCQSEVTKFKTQPNSCVAFGKTGIHQIQIAGLDAFDVLCDNETAGPGWLVIEQRINGGESFNRDWATFRKGFGRFEGDFFLGLEKIHRLSVDRFNELYIHMERFDGRVDFARYDRFVVGNENDKYRLNILGDFSGNVDDKLKPHSNMQFSTLDSDNDSWEGGSCATYRDAGWWYDSCVHSFLHGTYFDHKSDSYSAIYFNYPHSIRKLKIMMRPFEAPDVK